MYLRVRSIFPVILVFFFLSGCTTTPYREQTLTNRILFGYSGFSELKPEKSVLRIALVIPGHARRKRARQMMFLYAAERTLENGYQNFVFIDYRKVPKDQYWGGKLREQILSGKYGLGLSDPTEVYLRANFGTGNRSSAAFILMLSANERTNLIAHSAQRMSEQLKPLVIRKKQGES